MIILPESCSSRNETRDGAGAHASVSQPNPNTVNSRTTPDAQAWINRATELAHWAYGLRVRDDVHGRYYWMATVPGQPPRRKAHMVHEAVTHEDLVNHFRGGADNDRIALHLTNRDEHCRLAAVDIDAHDLKVDRQLNSSFARAVYRSAIGLGCDALLFDSNGDGGYHLFVIFDQPVPSANAYALGKWLVRDSREWIIKPPETFPKSAKLAGKGYGSMIRLPGHHHTYDHWTRVWDESRQTWLAGDEAISAILQTRGKSIDFSRCPLPRSERTARECAADARCRDAEPDSEEEARELEIAQQALECLGESYYDDYDRWLTVGMALRKFGDAGLDLWHAWSAQSRRKYEPDVLDQKWATFATARERSTGATIGIGTVIKAAKEEGWTGPLTPFERQQARTVTVRIDAKCTPPASETEAGR